MLKAFPYQASPRFGHAAIDYNQKLYIWGGHTQKLPFSPATKLTSCVDVYDLQTCTWKEEMCSGHAPLCHDGCAYVRDGDLLFVFGGWNGDMFYNSLHQLNLRKLEWKDVKLSKSGNVPSRKARAGMVKCSENLILFGGFGAIAIAQDPSLPQQKSIHEIEGLTNELHLFNISSSSWCRQETSHTPPPCASFSFVHIGQGHVVKFGGRQPDGCTNAIHILDLLTWDWTKVRPSECSPSARGGHASSYLANNLMITGGRGNDMQIYCDTWILDVTTMEWSQPKINFSEVNLKRCCHTATVICGEPNGTLVVIFGGMPKWKDTGVIPTMANLTVVDAGRDHWTLVSSSRHRTHHHSHKPHLSHLPRAKSVDLMPLTESSFEPCEEEEDQQEWKAVNVKATLPETKKGGAERTRGSSGQSSHRKRRRHSHPAKQGIVLPHRRSVPHDLIGRPWLVGKEEVQLAGDRLWKGEEEGEEVQVALFRGLKVAAHCIRSSKSCARAMKDVDTFIQLHHPNIVQLIGFTINNGLVVLSELMPTTLAAVLGSPGGLTRPQVVGVGLDVARALNYLHLMKPHPVVHGAVASVNVFLEPIQVNGWRAKLSCRPSVQAIRQAEPEGQPRGADSAAVHKGEGEHDSHKLSCSPNSDVYKFGLVLVEMTDGRNMAVRGGDAMGPGDRLGWAEVEDIAKKCMDTLHQSQPSMATVILSLSMVAK